jgi:hypothetical protein
VTRGINGRRRLGWRLLAPFLADIEAVAIRIMDPQAAIGRGPWRVNLPDPRPADRLPHCFKVLTRGTEGEVMEAFARTGVEQCALPLEGSGTQMHRIVSRRLAEEPERAVEFFSDGLIGHLKRVMKQCTDWHVDTSAANRSRLIPLFQCIKDVRAKVKLYFQVSGIP